MMMMMIMSCRPTFRHLPKLQECLQSNDVNYRIAVGETIALLVELGRDIDEVSWSQTVEAVDVYMMLSILDWWCEWCLQQFEVEDSESLCQCLKSLATDGNKHRAKNDRRKQRSIFREVLHYIEVRLKGWTVGPSHVWLNIWSFWNKTFSELHLVLSVLLQNEDFTEETIRFGVESVYIDSWVRRRIYDAFKEIMESGVRHHLQVRHVLWNNGSEHWDSRF